MYSKAIAAALTAAVITSPAAYAQTATDQSGETLHDQKRSAQTDKSERARMEDTSREIAPNTLLTRASEVYRKVVTDSNKPQRTETAQRAECVAVFPEITKGALVIGGQYGKGVASCRGPSDDWSQVSFVNISGASVGAQIGAKTTELVLLFMNDKAKQSLQQGQSNLGADLSVTAGETQAGVGVDTRRDVVAYSGESGAFANAFALEGTRISANTDYLNEFYGKETSHSDMLDNYGTKQTTPEASQFVQALTSREAEQKTS